MESEERDYLSLLPTELIGQILSYLSGIDLNRASQTSRLLRKIADDNLLWKDAIQQELPRHPPLRIQSSHKRVYGSLRPFWFLTRHKIWFSDHRNYGKLIIVRYNQDSNVLEGYAVAAVQSARRTIEFWPHNQNVIIHSFDPRVQLDTNTPVLKIDVTTRQAGPGHGTTFQRDFPMHTHTNQPGTASVYSYITLATALPESAISRASQLWPPLRLPAHARVRNQSHNNFNDKVHRPESPRDICEYAFRTRKGINFPRFINGTAVEIADEVATWATLPTDAYTPTAEKPYRGIWCGDYSGHGCEFLAILQPDDPQPLPRDALHILDARRRESIDSDDSWQTAQSDPDNDNVTDATAGSSVDSSVEVSPDIPPVTAPPQEDRLEAVKLTGDPNIPRGEYTFIAPDIGDAGLIRVADEPVFRGARIVRSVGHIAAAGFRDDEYISSQLILISHDKLAQYWEAFGHISFYNRVDIDSLT